MSQAGYTEPQTAKIKADVTHAVDLRELIRLASNETIDLKAYEADMRQPPARPPRELGVLSSCWVPSPSPSHLAERVRSSPPVAETRDPAVSFTKRRPQTPERVPEPEPEGPLRLSHLTRCRNGLGEGGRCVLPLQDRLPGYACRRRCFPKETAFL